MWDEKYICHHCVEDKYVRKMIVKSGNILQNCSYCDHKRLNVKLDFVVKLMNDVFEYYYDIYEDVYDTGHGDTAQDIICEELGVEYEIADDIYNSLGDEFNPYNDYELTRYNDDFVYRSRNFKSGELDYTWEHVTNTLLKETRYFNREVRNFLDSLFRDIEKLKTKNRKSPIRLLSEKDVLYRARVFEDVEEVEKALEQPERNFGPPPSSLARSGRMNAQGISVFYGATSPDLAIAEVRPPVGSIVVTAPFVPQRALRVLDISALDALSFGSGSKFDPQTRQTVERAVFFKTLSRKLTLPVFGKRQDSNYLITQVVADYLSDHQKFKLDGVSFKSTQVATASQRTITGYNVVLFNKPSLVRHGRDKNRLYKVQMFEHEDDGHFMLSPGIRLIAEEQKTQRFMRSSPETDSILVMKSDGMVLHTITGVQYKTDDTDICQGDTFFKTVIPDKFDENVDF